MLKVLKSGKLKVNRIQNTSRPWKSRLLKVASLHFTPVAQLVHSINNMQAAIFTPVPLLVHGINNMQAAMHKHNKAATDNR
jgi:hypothetical protein